MEEKTTASVSSFCEGRGLPESKVTMLRYLEKVADKCWVEVKPKGNSRIVAEFDCGAYKGSEVITLSIKNLCPFSIARNLMTLTSGHHFSFPEAEAFLISQFSKEMGV